MDKNATIQAHGKTHAEIEEIGQQQVNGEEVFIPANNAKPDQIGDPYFKTDFADHKIADHEVGYYHIAKEARLFSQTGAVPQRLSVPQVIKLTPKFYEFMKENHAFDGSITHILHDPTKAGQEEEDEDDDQGGKDINEMTVAELRDFITERDGTAPKSGLTKAELLEIAKGEE